VHWSAQMPATVVEACDEQWAMSEGRVDWQVTTPSKLVACLRFRPALARAEPRVRRLSPGGRWIRTIGPPVTCELCWRGPPLLPARGSGSGSARFLLFSLPFHGAGLPHGLGGLRLAV
jgi:hypothetical protein